MAEPTQKRTERRGSDDGGGDGDIYRGRGPAGSFDAVAAERSVGRMTPRRYRWLRLVFLWTMASAVASVLFWSGFEFIFLFTDLGDSHDFGLPTWPTVVAFALGLLAVGVGVLVARQLLDGDRRVDPHLYWGLFTLLLLICAFLRVSAYAFLTGASIWAMLVVSAPRRRTLAVTPLLVALAWLHAWSSPLGEPWGFIGMSFLFSVAYGLLMWMAVVVSLWLWEVINEAVDSRQVLSRLAVNRERLRFATDLRTLLGHSLNALVVGARRAEHLVEDDPERAKTEIDGVHRQARRILQQVRSTVSGYRDLDLQEETASVRAVLEANGTTTTVTGLSGALLPPRISRLAAWVVREGGTNVLRHSDARRCRITFTIVEAADGGGRLEVEMCNDGVRVDESADTMSEHGTSGLAERIRDVGGTLTASPTDGGDFLLRAVLPLPVGAKPGKSGAGASAPSVRTERTILEPRTSVVEETVPVPKPQVVGEGDTGSGSPIPPEAGTKEGAGDGIDHRDRRLRVAKWFIFALLFYSSTTILIMPLFDLAVTVVQDWALWRPVVAAVLSLFLVGACALLLKDRLNGNRKPRPWLYRLSLVVLVLASILLNFPVTGLAIVGCWWGIGVLVAPRRTSAWVTAFLFLVLPVLLVPTFSYSFEELNLLAYLLAWTVGVGVGLFVALGTVGTLWLWDVCLEAVEGQRARARLAVTEERLRFARDMHDLLGHSLSALAVKAQLAGRLVDRAPERAATEMAQVQELAGTALNQVRFAVNGYWEADLGDEVASVGAILEAGGTRLSVTGLEGLKVPPRVAGLAAWVVREAGTNVLRHSDAQQCQITFTLAREDGTGPDTLVLEVHNDRAEEPKAGGYGNGLTGLSERVAVGGGTVSAARTREGGFLLRAALPLSTGPGQDTPTPVPRHPGPGCRGTSGGSVPG